MTNRPVSYPLWTNGPSATVVQPPAELSTTGWAEGQAPDAENVNWQFWDIGEWIMYLDGIVSQGLPNAWMRLVNGGIWDFNATTGVLRWGAAANVSIPGIDDSSNAFAAGNVTILDGEVAYVDINNPVSSLGDTDGITNTITNIAFVANIEVGMQVSGLGITPGTTVVSIGANSVVLSAVTTSANIQSTYTFYNNSALTVTVVDEDTFLPTLSQVMIAKRSGNIIYLGINSAQMVLRDGEFKELISTGYSNIYTGVAGENLVAGQCVYISPGPTDSGRTADAFYLLDVSAANSSVRGNFGGVVITDALTGAPVTVVFSGFYEFPSVTPGLEYYADPAVPGGIISAPPTGLGEKIMPIGFAVPFGSGLNTASLLVTGGVGSIASTPANFLFNQEVIGYGNGSQTAFNLTQSALNASALFVFVDSHILPMTEWSLLGNVLTLNSAPGVGIEVFVAYVLASQIYLNASQEQPLPVSGSDTVFSILGNPSAQQGLCVYVDGEILPNTEWSIAVVGIQTQITLATALAPGQTIYATYFTSMGGTITGAANEGVGTGIFDTIISNILRFKSLKAGANVTISDDGMGNVTIASSGSGGGIESHGSAGAPVSINPAVGVVPTTAQDQVWWITPSSGSGAVPITALPAIAAGSSVGQRLKLKSVSAVNFLVIPNGAGTDMNGDCNMGGVSPNFAQTIELTWDGTNWSEDFRRV